MLHGRGGSIGCIAVDNPDIEEIFMLAAHVDLSAIQLLIAPYDFRIHPLPAEKASEPAWLPERYRDLQTKMLAVLPSSDPAIFPPAAPQVEE